MKNKIPSVLIALILVIATLSTPVSASSRNSIFPNQLTEAIHQKVSEPPEEAALNGAVPASLATPQLIQAAQAQGKLDQNTAYLYLAYALDDYEKLPVEYRSDVAWEGTLPLLRLQEAVKTMPPGETRAAIEALLTGSCSSSSGAMSNITNTTHFHVEYNTIGGGLTISNYTDSLETTWNTEITSFGWAAPPVLTSNPPPGNRYHVRIDNLGGGLYGYVSSSGTHAGYVGNNPNTTWNDIDAYASCMVLNNNYTGFPGTPQKALDATAAHEFNHSIQFGYGALSGSNSPDDSFVEGGATWMEDEVFDDSNDNHNYLWPVFSMCMGEYTDSPYSYWITLRGLTERYGTSDPGGGEQIMQDFWELTSQSSTSNMFTAINTALVNKGTNLADAYHYYAVAVKFNRACGGGYVYPYCLEEGPAYVSAAGATTVHGAIAAVGGSYNGSVADNYALNWISLPASGGPYDVTLQNTSSGGQLRGSVACDTGSALNVYPLPAVVGAGSSSTLLNFDPSGCSSVAAVVTNQSQTAVNPSSCTARSYTLSTAESAPAIPTTQWEKLVYVNGAPIADLAAPIPVRPADRVHIVDRVNITFTGAVSFTLLEEWSDSLTLTPPVTLTAGQVSSSTNWLNWTATNVPTRTWHTLTKTFQINTGSEGVDIITETLITDGNPTPMQIPLTFVHIASIAKDGPSKARRGEAIPYAITLQVPPSISGALVVTDALPPGVTFAGGLDATYGTAWYSDATAAIYWTAQPAFPSAITITFDVTVTAEPGSSVTNLATLNTHGILQSDGTTLNVLPEFAWTQEVYINSSLVNAFPALILPNDLVVVINRARVAHTRNVTFTLADSWMDSLNPTDWASSTGGTSQVGRTLVWTATNAAPNTWHLLTQIFRVVEGNWEMSAITATLHVEEIDPQPANRVLEFNRLRPEIAVAPNALTATLPQGSHIATQTMTLDNTGNQTLNWALAEVPNVNWLAELPNEGSIASSGTLTLVVTFSAASLTPDVYTTMLHITSDDPIEGLIEIPVTLTVQAPLPPPYAIYLPTIIKE